MHEVNEETHWIRFQQERSVVTSHTMSFFQPVAGSSTECLRNCPSCLLELVSLRKSSQTKGNNFMSGLLKELYRLLQIWRIRTSPYHPQTDGLVEKFNGTLKMMLRKSVPTIRRTGMP